MMTIPESAPASHDLVVKLDAPFNIDAYLPQEVARGNQGVVYYGVCPETAEQVVIKQSEQSSALPECMAFQRLHASTKRHPNVLYARNIFLSPTGPPVIVMPRLARSLFDVLEELETTQATLPTATVDHLIRGVLEGVAHLHSLGLYHRDIKPENILINGADPATAQPVLCDYGLCSMHDVAAPRNTLCTGRVGTAEYCPPEVWQCLHSEPVYDGDKVDVFSVAITMFVLLTGFVPWESTSPGDKLYETWQRDPHTFFLWAAFHSDNALEGRHEAAFLLGANPDPSLRGTPAQVFAALNL